MKVSFVARFQMTNLNALCSGILLSFLLIPQIIGPAEAGDTLNQKIAKADELLNKGKAKSAASILRGIVASHPDNALAHMELGAALASLVDDDNYDAAIEEEKLTLKLAPGSYGARKILGHIYTNLHKPDEAISTLEEACTIKPSSYAARRDLAVAQMTAGKNELAIQNFRKAIQLDPSRADAHQKLSSIFLAQDNVKEAIAEGRKAVKLDVANPNSHLALANAILASGDKIATIEIYETALQTNWSKDYRNALTAASALSGLGWAFAVKNAGSKEFSEALSDQRKAIRICPSFGPAYVRLAELLGRQGKIKEADSIYKIAIELSKEDAGVTVTYARFLAKTQRRNEARTVLKKLLEKNPDCKKALDALNDLDNERAT